MVYLDIALDFGVHETAGDHFLAVGGSQGTLLHNPMYLERARSIDEYIIILQD
jgi:hypothetical protein